MMTVLGYMVGLAKAAAGPLWTTLKHRTVGVRITSPRDGATVGNRYVPVQGKYKRDLGIRYLCFYQKGAELFYPQGPIELHRTRKEWTHPSVCVGHEEGVEHRIIVAAVSDELNVACELYYRTGEKHGRWEPLVLRTIPDGLVILDTISVKLAPGR